jgi:erythromycin esterase
MGTVTSAGVYTPSGMGLAYVVACSTQDSQICNNQAVVSAAPPAPQWVSYVQAQANPIQSIDASNTDYSDLAFLEPILQGRDIVELGESGHGVAEFSQAKIRLIKYLHEQLGYDVIAFESSILSCYLANEQSSQLTPKAFMQNSVFAVWSTTDVENLFSYIQSTQTTAHPLTLAGFDVQLTTPYEEQNRPTIFQQVVGQVDPTYAQQVYTMDQTFILNSGQNSYILANYSDLKTKYQALTAFLDANMTQIQKAYPTRPLFPTVVRQAAWGMSAYLDELNDMALSTSGNYVDSNSPRDAGMATNLELLVDNLYAGKKVMVWAHNAHIMHNGSSYNNDDFENMGSYIFSRYGTRVYTLGLYMYQGSAIFNTGGVWVPSEVYTIPPASAVSVEGLLHTAGDPFVFLDLSEVPGSSDETAWMYENYPIREWGVEQGEMIVTSEYDGILQIDTVHPPAFVSSN